MFRVISIPPPLGLEARGRHNRDCIRDGLLLIGLAVAKAKGGDAKKRREKIEVAHKFLEIMDSPESVLLKGILYGLLFIANRRDGERNILFILSLES